MKNSTGFFKSIEDQMHGWMWIGKPMKTLGGTNVQINEKKYDITPGIQKALVGSSYDTMKSMPVMDKEFQEMVFIVLKS